MSQKVIQIDEEKCVGCGICANTCQQSAIEMVDGKAKVMRKSACDGIGNCLPVCPVGAISFSDMDVSAKVVEEGGIIAACPGTLSVKLDKKPPLSGGTGREPLVSALAQWPVQLQLVLEDAAFFQGANLLLAADCTAFSYGNFHQEFMKNRVTLIACPKLDQGSYTEKITAILQKNEIMSVTVVRMEVPCCGGLAVQAEEALAKSGKHIPYQCLVLSTDGRIL